MNSIPKIFCLTSLGIILLGGAASNMNNDENIVLDFDAVVHPKFKSDHTVNVGNIYHEISFYGDDKFGEVAGMYIEYKDINLFAMRNYSIPFNFSGVNVVVVYEVGEGPPVSMDKVKLIGKAVMKFQS